MDESNAIEAARPTGAVLQVVRQILDISTGMVPGWLKKRLR
jgi:hypothetical protein